MARINSLGSFLVDVATAIKTKLGVNDTIAAEDFDTKILEIPVGPDTSDANATTTDIANNKSGYVDGVKVIGSVPTIESNNYGILNKTEKPDSGDAYYITSMKYNVNDGSTNTLILTDGQVLDLSTLPEDITGKNVFIYCGSDENFDRWGLFITDMDNTFCLSAHDNTYAMNCRNENRSQARDMSYYQGATLKTDNGVDINNVDWGQKHVWDKAYLIELYVKYGKYNVYATKPVYWGQFGSYSNIQFAGATQYRYCQDNKITTSSAGLTQNNSLLAKENSHVYTPIYTDLIVQNEQITANKIKIGETILGVTGTLDPTDPEYIDNLALSEAILGSTSKSKYI